MGQEDFLQRIKKIVLEREQDAKIYLYGSRVKGTSHTESDWDLLILLKKDSITSGVEKNITDPLYDLELETGEIISPMIYSEQDWNSRYGITPFYNNVMREGKLL
jgi:predicted nucleotidyltransferase